MLKRAKASLQETLLRQPRFCPEVKRGEMHTRFHFSIRLAINKDGSPVRKPHFFKWAGLAGSQSARNQVMLFRDGSIDSTNSNARLTMSFIGLNWQGVSGEPETVRSCVFPNMFESSDHHIESFHLLRFLSVLNMSLSRFVRSAFRLDRVIQHCDGLFVVAITETVINIVPDSAEAMVLCTD